MPQEINNEDMPYWYEAIEEFKKVCTHDPENANDWASVYSEFKNIKSKTSTESYNSDDYDLAILEKLGININQIENISEENIVSLNVPLIIRLFEYFNETSLDDKTLHDITENILEQMKSKDSLSMEDYDTIISNNKPNEIESVYTGIKNRLENLR